VSIVIIAEERSHELYHPFDSIEDDVFKCTPAESHKIVDRCRADLVILDCGVDAEKGLQFMKELKTSHPGTPIIFVSDIGSEDIVLRVFKTGARDFFKKPLDDFELQETVKGILSVKRNSKETRRPFMKRTASQSEKGSGKGLSVHSVNFSHAFRYIEKNLSHEITLDDIAKEANLSKYHFCRLFKKRVGMTPLRFATFMRIEKAKELLKKDDHNISTAAATVGFNDISSFIKQFKRLTGMTPSSYRKSLK
jgi:YesN/AraC family two-component response regulator